MPSRRRRLATAHNGPKRTCVGCRTTADPTGWCRVAATSAGLIGTGPAAPGRGAWICSAACFDRAVRRQALARALRQDLSNDQIAALRARLFKTLH